MPIIDGVQVYDCVHYDKSQELGEDCCLEFQCLNCNNYEEVKCETRKDCYYKQLMKTLQKLQWVNDCTNNYLSENTIDSIDPKFYKEWMLNVKNKIITELESEA